MKKIGKRDEYEIDDRRFIRTFCTDCRRRLTPCVKITDEGVQGKHPVAWICENEKCDRFSDIDGTGWHRT